MLQPGGNNIMEKTTIILVRHGETDWNKELIFRGRIDVPLNETGPGFSRKWSFDPVCGGGEKSG